MKKSRTQHEISRTGILDIACIVQLDIMIFCWIEIFNEFTLQN